MTPAARLELATEARADVAGMIALLERPTIQALDQSAEKLLAASARIQQLNEDGEGGGAPLRSAIIALRKDLQRAGLLLRHAWEFRVGSSGQPAAYTRKGELTAQPMSGGRLKLEG